MNVARVLGELAERGIRVMLEHGRLVCRAPRGAVTGDIAASLREHRATIEAFVRDGMAERRGGGVPVLEAAAREEFMPVSYSQERLWYLSQVDANPAVYNLPLSFRVTGPLDVRRLQRCLNELEARHEALRTTVVDRDGRAAQRIVAPRGLPLTRHDARPGRRGGADPDQLLEREAMAPFDLARGPLVRATLIRSGDREYYFLLVAHHIVSDGISTQILLRDLVALYEDGALPPLPVQFADYAAWQRRWLTGDALSAELAYWREALAEPLPTLDIATDWPRPPVRSANGAKEPLRLSRELVRALSAIGRDEGATPFMVMLALYLVLLHRHSGQDDLVVGTPVANRTRPETAGIVGFVANTVVLRTRFGGRPSFREVLGRVRDACVGAFRHQDMPFQKIVEMLNPPRDLSRTPVFQAFFTFHEITSQAERMGDLDLQPVVAGSTVSRMDLSLFVREHDGEMLASLEYNTDLFSRETACRMAGRFQTLARAVAAAPDRPVAELEIRASAERDAVARWNATAEAIPEDTLEGLVSRQAGETPDRVAVRAANAATNYRELEERANGAAHALRARGVGPGDLVGVCVGRGADMLPAMLGVLKAGAAWVPLDPEYPLARLCQVANDAELRAVVHDAESAVQVPEGIEIVMDIGACGAATAPPPRTHGPDDLAYVIYTSGSTGRPKGVEVRHRNVVNFLIAMRARPGMASDDVLVAVTTPAFDIAILELFLPLTVGATVVVASRAATMDGAMLAALIADERATVVQATPATWRMLIEAGWAGYPLRALCGGEALPPELARRLLPAVLELWNMYGPTETTIWSTCGRVTDPEAPIGIGTPIANTVLRVVDAHGAEAPLGVPGELYIGGAGVAAGYRARPDLTVERFTGDPLGAAGMPFYRTGDRVRWTADGALEHLGRLDTQVKVRGFRIELGEVEAVLESLPAVREAAACVHQEHDGDARLVAYVVPDPAEHATGSEIRRYLRERLPDFMVPGMVVELDAMPRTPNGKVDRHRLPNPLRAASAERRYQAPATPAERIIAETWRDLLGVAQVGRQDNFFELGGHSLLSMRAVAELEGRTGVRLDPRLMFFQTVEQIAAQMPTHLRIVAS